MMFFTVRAAQVFPILSWLVGNGYLIHPTKHRRENEVIDQWTAQSPLP